MKWFIDLPNYWKVILMGGVSFSISGILFCLVIHYIPSLLTINGFWTFYILIISSPIAFIVWFFRDYNATEQIENARKDTNLKEFQKLAEWISGIHLIEDKIIRKKQFEEGGKVKIIEEVVESYTSSGDILEQNYSKKEGAIGLQITAIYNLLPFYRGDYGASFRKPALNLLLSAWSTMQKRDLLLVNNDDEAIERIRERGNSALGIAITHTLLAEGGSLFLDFINELPNSCLAGMNFNLLGLDLDNIKVMFKSSEIEKLRLKNIDFTGANLQKMDFGKSQLIESVFLGALLHNSKFSHCYVERCIFDKCFCDSSEFFGIHLTNSDFYDSQLTNCNLGSSTIDSCRFDNANLRLSDLSSSQISPVTSFCQTILESANFSDANLQYINLANAGYNYSRFDNAIITHAILEKLPEGCKFFGANLCNSRIFSFENIQRNQWEGAFLFEEDCGNDINLFIDKGAIIIPTRQSTSDKRFYEIKFIHKEKGDKYIFSNRYTSLFDIDFERTAMLNSNKWDVIRLS